MAGGITELWLSLKDSVDLEWLIAELRRKVSKFVLTLLTMFDVFPFLLAPFSGPGPKEHLGDPEN